MVVLSHRLHTVYRVPTMIFFIYLEQCQFPIRFSNKDTSRNDYNHYWGSSMVDTWWYQTIWSSTLMNFKWHSKAWPYTLTLSTDQTLHRITEFTTFLPNLIFYRIKRGFHLAFATNVICTERTLTSPDNCFCLIWDLYMLCKLIPIILKSLSWLLGLCIFNIQRQFRDFTYNSSLWYLRRVVIVLINAICVWQSQNREGERERHTEWERYLCHQLQGCFHKRMLLHETTWCLVKAYGPFLFYDQMLY